MIWKINRGLRVFVVSREIPNPKVSAPNPWTVNYLDLPVLVSDRILLEDGGALNLESGGDFTLETQ